MATALLGIHWILLSGEGYFTGGVVSWSTASRSAASTTTRAFLHSAAATTVMGRILCRVVHGRNRKSLYTTLTIPFQSVSASPQVHPQCPGRFNRSHTTSAGNLPSSLSSRARARGGPPTLPP